MKNLLPISHSAHYFPNLKALIGAGTEVEDARKSGAMEEVKHSSPARKDLEFGVKVSEGAKRAGT